MNIKHDTYGALRRAAL